MDQQTMQTKYEVELDIVDFNKMIRINTEIMRLYRLIESLKKKTYIDVGDDKINELQQKLENKNQEAYTTLRGIALKLIKNDSQLDENKVYFYLVDIHKRVLIFSESPELIQQFTCNCDTCNGTCED